MKSKVVTLKVAAEILDAALSTIQEWLTTSQSPSDLIAAKKFANHFGVSLATLLTSTPDHIQNGDDEELFIEIESLFEGYAIFRFKK